MTCKEAIEFGEDHIGLFGGQMDMFISMAIKALENDIPKSPKKSDIPRYGMGYEYHDWYCPTCNKFLAFECDTNRQYIHHCKCGQRLDWRHENE